MKKIGVLGNRYYGRQESYRFLRRMKLVGGMRRPEENLLWRRSATVKKNLDKMVVER